MGEAPLETEVETNGHEVSDDKDKAALLEATRLLVEKSSQKVSEAKAGTEAIRIETEDARQANLSVEVGVSNTRSENDQDGEFVTSLSNVNTRNNVQTAADEEEAELIVKRQKERELAEKEQHVRMSRRKQ